jgi:hypothetical protein
MPEISTASSPTQPTRTVLVRFALSTPVIMRNLLHLDAILAARIAASSSQPMSTEDIQSAIPIPQQDGIFLCSAAFYAGSSPEKRRVCFQQNIWNVAEFDLFAKSLENPTFLKGRRDKQCPTNLDEYSSMSLPYLDFLATVYTEGFPLFEYLLHDVHGLGKKTGHGFGRVSSCRITDHDGHPWVMPGSNRMVSRAIPVTAWLRQAKSAPDLEDVGFVKDYVTATFPYHEDHAEPCVTPDDEEVLNYRFFAKQEENSYA